MEENEKMAAGLPDNAFRELKEGEKYEPIMKPDQVYPEVNGWSVTWGILMAILFSAAAAYLGLKVGGRFYGSQAQQGIGRECHYSKHRCMFGCRGSWSHLHLACYLYPPIKISRHDGVVREDIHGFRIGWNLGYFVLNTFPQVLCQRHARQISFPRSHRNDTGIGFW